MSSASERAIRSVAVAGDGIVGLSAAIAFARALPRAEVSIIETSADPAALAERMANALPSIGRFHAAIGLDELDLVQSEIATHHLATRFDQWSASGEPWVHAFGGYGRPVGVIPFDQIWARAWRRNKARPYHHYSSAAVLAERNKFVHPPRDSSSPASALLYGLRLNPDRYRDRLKAEAANAKIRTASGDIQDLQLRSDSSVEAVILDGGLRVQADLFIDCTGPRAQLLSRIDDEFEEWSNIFPCDRLLIGSRQAEAVPSPADRVTAVEIGWTGEWPFTGEAMTGVAFRSDIPDEKARRHFASREVETVTLRPGRRPRPWVRNVLAIGDAATALDPLQGTNLDLAHHGILLALELLPGRDCHPLELREYNRRFERVTTRVRDFVAVHYLRSGRSTAGFWRQAAEGAVPDSLARTLDQYESRGRMPFHEDETVTRESWTAALLGIGVLPRGSDPMAAGVPFDESASAMERLALQLDELADRAPAYDDYLARMKKASARPATR